MKEKSSREELVEFFRLEPKEEASLAAVRELVLRLKVWEKLYPFLSSFEKTKEILSKHITSREKLRELSEKHKAHFEALFSEPFSEAFQIKAERVGRVHAERSVRPYMFLGALYFLHKTIFNEIYATNLEEEDKKDLLCVTTKLLCYDAALILKAYFKLYSHKLERSLEETLRLNRVYSLLREVNVLIYEERQSVEKLFQEICEILNRLGGFSLVWIGKEDETGLIKPVAASGRVEYLSEMKPISKEIAAKEGFSRDLEVISSGEPIVINDIESDPRFASRRSKALQYGFRSMVVLPIFFENQVKAFLFLYGDKPSVFTESELRLMMEIARDVSLAWMHIEKGKRLEKLLFFDELTGLGNERYLLEALERELDIAKKRKLKLALMRLDIDDFSFINHNYGYAAGDRVLKTIAERLKSLGNLLGPVARTGPDDFTVSCQMEHEKEVHGILLEVKKLFERPVECVVRPIKFSVSIGVAVYPKDATTPEALYEAATIALKKAKKKSPKGLAFYTEEETKEVVERFKFLDELERAYENNEFVLHFQPKISLWTRRISGFEALMRWNHPQLGIIPPGKFISVLEDSGLILEVGKWVVEETVKFTEKVLDLDPKIVVSFNASVKQLEDGEVVKTLRKVIGGGRIPARNLQMEVTERVLMEERQARKVLEEVKALGCEIAIDDFGTGFSSLVYLKRIPAETLKIDFSFVKGTPDDREDVEIVKAIAALAKNLGKRCVAEGVETREQLAFLTGLGVDEVQGFYFARPLPEEKALEFLKTYKPETYFWR